MKKKILFALISTATLFYVGDAIAMNKIRNIDNLNQKFIEYAGDELNASFPRQYMENTCKKKISYNESLRGIKKYTQEISLINCVSVVLDSHFID